MSDNHIVSVNGYLTSDEFSTKVFLKLMKWASTSKQAKEMLSLQEEYLQKVLANKVMMGKIKQLVK